MITLISSKKLGVCNNMRYTVHLLNPAFSYDMAIVIVLHPISWKFASSSILSSANFSVKIVIVLFVMKISINTRTYKAISQTVQCNFFRLRIWNPVQFFGMFFSVYMKSKIKFLANQTWPQ